MELASVGWPEWNNTRMEFSMRGCSSRDEEVSDSSYKELVECTRESRRLRQDELRKHVTDIETAQRGCKAADARRERREADVSNRVGTSFLMRPRRAPRPALARHAARRVHLRQPLQGPPNAAPPLQDTPQRARAHRVDAQCRAAYVRAHGELPRLEHRAARVRRARARAGREQVHVVIVTLMAHMRVDLDEMIDDLRAFRQWSQHRQETDADARAQAVGRAPKPKFPETFRMLSRFEVLGVTEAPANPRWDIHSLTQLGETCMRPVDALALALEDAAQDMAPALSRSLQRKLTCVERKHAERVRRLRESERLAALAEGVSGDRVPCADLCIADALRAGLDQRCRDPPPTRSSIPGRATATLLGCL
ncbi:hypothetical protein HETIRDRAFT_116880 [Heterobasidion irregulare TC 32-1]|uniref:Uncharacterized protein n=1 Tax=Heterobasidion irregulare (strain TC 32-1) TaxID=747525 RepID=W4KG56_HETIT|nr:uncharacterized protein HETIRDRAFT_116880 [Heterobasidion irregulare TC 32-1]ETW84719.1 hypothetical protein HETIRDRAFT_116880 [Heterobasidion irregulare TC 32-1]